MTSSHHTFGLSGGWCRWHNGPTDTEIGTLVTHSTSGPPRLIPACRSCRDAVAADAAKEARERIEAES